MIVINKNIIIINLILSSSSSNMTFTSLPSILMFPCSSEYSQEATLYPSCIPTMCGVITRNQFIPGHTTHSLLAEIVSLTRDQHQVFTAMDLHTHTMVRDGVTSKMEEGADHKLRQLLVPVVDKVEMLVKE